MKVVSSLKYHRLLIIIYKLIILFIFSSISANFLSRFFYRSIKLCDKNCLIRIRDFSSYYTETCSVSSRKKKLHHCAPEKEDTLFWNPNLPHNFTIENLFLSYESILAPSGSTPTSESLLSSLKVLKRS